MRYSFHALLNCAPRNIGSPFESNAGSAWGLSRWAHDVIATGGISRLESAVHAIRYHEAASRNSEVPPGSGLLNLPFPNACILLYNDPRNGPRRYSDTWSLVNTDHPGGLLCRDTGPLFRRPSVEDLSFPRN